MEHSSLGRSGHFVFRGSDLWCQLGLILNYWKEFPGWTNWTFNASRRNQKNSEMQHLRRPEAWYAKELNKLNQKIPPLCNICPDRGDQKSLQKRSTVFPARTPLFFIISLLCACDWDCDCLHHFPSCLILVGSSLQRADSVWCSFRNIVNVILLLCFAEPAMCIGTKT